MSLDDFKQCDEILSEASFQHLEQVRIKLYLAIAEKDLPSITQSPSTAAAAAVAKLISEGALTGCDTTQDFSNAYVRFLMLVRDTVQHHVGAQFGKSCERNILKIEIEPGRS